jgi:hypothetical protein
MTRGPLTRGLLRRGSMTRGPLSAPPSLRHPAAPRGTRAVPGVPLHPEPCGVLSRAAR